MEGRRVRVFVVVSHLENYVELLHGTTLPDGRVLEVDQAPWADVEAVAFGQGSLVLHGARGGRCAQMLTPSAVHAQRTALPGTRQAERRSFSPDVVLLRSYVLGTPSQDHRRVMAALHHANVVTVNSLASFTLAVDKAVLFGALRRVRDACPSFPLVEATYYSSSAVGGFVEAPFPVVVKLGSASQGVGKARVAEGAWSDTLSLLAMQTDGFCVEPLIAWVGDVRVQKIGRHYRAIRRRKVPGGSVDAWKANDAMGIAEEVRPCPPSSRWLCSRLPGCADGRAVEGVGRRVRPRAADGDPGARHFAGR